jgi:hypothetical protein
MAEAEYVDLVTGWRVHESTGETDVGTPFREISITHPQTGAVYRRSDLIAAGSTPERISEWVRRILAAEAEAKDAEKSSASGKRHPDPTIRRCQRVLLMVHELHKLGYQRLRISPGLSPSGCYWRCVITPAANILTTHGALTREYFFETAHYTSGSEAAYFDWPDVKRDTARELARKFILRFPTIAEQAQGRDHEYVGWYVEMLGLAEDGALPIAYADWYYDPNARYLRTSGAEDVRLPVPPGGEAEPYPIYDGLPS